MKCLNKQDSEWWAEERERERLVTAVSLLQMGSWGLGIEQFALSLKRRWWQNQDSNSALLHSRQKHPFWPFFSMTGEIPSLKVGWEMVVLKINSIYERSPACCPWFLLLHSHIAGWRLLFSHPGTSVHLRHLRFTICEFFAWTLHTGPTTDTAPTSWNPGRADWTKRAYPGMPKTDKAPTELDSYPNFQLQI